MESISAWLHSLGLDQYARVFDDNYLDLEVLPSLSEPDLEKLGLPMGHRKKLLKAIADLSIAEAGTTAVATTREAVPDQSSEEQARPQGERRQLTVLFCDMVGFTELASRVDPEVLQKVIRSYEDACAVCITRYEGYVFQRLGDGIVAFFGYPLAHEGEAERAIRAGLEIIASLSKLDVQEAGHLQVRIGIATGLVVVASAEKGAVGETMNLAARLQGIAQVNSIVVSERVHRLAGGAFDYEDLGEQMLKGIAKPTHAWCILGVSEAASRFEAAHERSGLTPLVGREQELGLLLERWQLAQDGEGQVVLLSGEPGIGKSRILSALRERLEVQGAQALRFQCSPYYVNSAFWPSIDNFERALKFGRDESPESKLDKLEALMVTHYGRPRADARFVASMLSIPCEARYGAVNMTPQKHKDETLRTLVDLTEAAARKQPSVMLFEDAHWADPTTLEVLDLLIDRVRGIPLLIVLTHRPEFVSRWSQHSHVINLNLSKLTRAQSSSMITRVTGGKTLPADLLEQILTKTDGVPLFVEELTKSILESGELKEAADHYDYAGVTHAVTIPATLRDSLMARLDRFAPVKEIAQIGAAIGREFSYELIAAVAPMSPTRLDSALSQLTDSGLAFRRGTPPEATYTFKHALVQDAAYDTLLKSRRQELHAKIARVIEERFPEIKDAEPEVLAHHFTAAEMLDQAVAYWKRAGELAHARIALQEAIAHLERGLAVAQTLPPSQSRDRHEVELRGLLGMAWIALQGWAYPAVGEHLERAYIVEEALGPGQHSLRILWGLWVYKLALGRTRESLSMAEELLGQGRAKSDEDMLQAGLWAAVTTHYWLGEFERSIEYADTILERYDPVRHHGLADALNHDPKTVALQYKAASQGLLGFTERAMASMKETLEHARNRGHAFDLAWALFFAVYQLHGVLGDAEAIDLLLTELEQLAREQRLLVYEHVLGPYCRAVRDLICRATEDARQLLHQLIPSLAAIGLNAVLAEAKTALAHCAVLTKEPVQALALIDETLAIITQPGGDTRYRNAEVLRVRGLALQVKGELGEAEMAFRAAFDVARSQNAKLWELRTSTSLAKLWQSQGKRKEAFDLLQPVYDWFTEGFDTKDLKEAKALLEELAG